MKTKLLCALRDVECREAAELLQTPAREAGDSKMLRLPRVRDSARNGTLRKLSRMCGYTRVYRTLEVVFQVEAACHNICGGLSGHRRLVGLLLAGLRPDKLSRDGGQARGCKLGHRVHSRRVSGRS